MANNLNTQPRNPSGGDGSKSTTVNRYKRYYAGFSVRLGILRSAAISFSILSFLTTLIGFQNTIFNGNLFMAGIASAAIQSVLLAGIFFYCPIINKILNSTPDEDGARSYVEKTSQSGSKPSVEDFFPKRQGVKVIVIGIAIVIVSAIAAWNKVPDNVLITTKVLTALLTMAFTICAYCLVLGLIPDSKLSGWKYIQIWLITGIIMVAMCISSMFSCVSIIDSLYATDYSRDSDPAIEQTIRKQLLNLDQDIEALLEREVKLKNTDGTETPTGESMRLYLIKKITEANEAIEEAAKPKAENYFLATPELLAIQKPGMLYDLGDYPVDEKNGCYIQEGYAASSGQFKIDGNGQEEWNRNIDDLINTLNGEKYLIYLNYYKTYETLIDNFNKIGKAATKSAEEANQSNENADIKVSLVQVKAIRNSLITLRDTIALEKQTKTLRKQRQDRELRQAVKAEKKGEETFLIQLENLHTYRESSNHPGEQTVHRTRAKVIDSATDTCLNLWSAIDSAINNINDYIEIVYGDPDVLTVDEIIEIIGLSEPTEETQHIDLLTKKRYSDVSLLEKAASQLRNAQGNVLANSTSNSNTAAPAPATATTAPDTTDPDTTDPDTTDLHFDTVVETLNDYVQLMSAKAELSTLSQKLNTSYIIREKEELEKEEMEEEEKPEKQSLLSLLSWPKPEKKDETTANANASAQAETEPAPTSNSSTDAAITNGDTSAPTQTESATSSNASTDVTESKEDEDDDDDDDDKEDDENRFKVEKVSVEAWKEIRGGELSHLKEMVTKVQFVQTNLGAEQNQQTGTDNIEEIDRLIHMYINETPLEKAYNLLFNAGINQILSENTVVQNQPAVENNKEPTGQSAAPEQSDAQPQTAPTTNIKKQDYFQYRGKAFLAFGIAVFMDLGSALIGVLMYFLDPKEMERVMLGFAQRIQKSREKFPKPN